MHLKKAKKKYISVYAIKFQIFMSLIFISSRAVHLLYFRCWKYVKGRMKKTWTKYVLLPRLMTWISVSTLAWHCWEVTKKMTVPQSWWLTCHTDEMSMIQLCFTSSSYLVCSSCSLNMSLEINCSSAYFSLHKKVLSVIAVTNGKWS